MKKYVALSKAAKEIKFVYQFLIGMGMKVKLPIVVRVDNLGAIFKSENVLVSQKTKHIDIRYRFVQEFVFDRFIKVIFVKTKIMIPIFLQRILEESRMSAIQRR